MKATYIDYSETHSFSSTALNYLAADPKLSEFISHFPSMEGFKRLIEKREHPANRQVLVDVLKKQYAGRLKSDVNRSLVDSNIELLAQSNTYTVTTGHQLNLFTGPLYFLYKIVNTINLAKELKETFPDKHFVPVYWMASEDHDFAEINHTTLHGKLVEWDQDKNGATGRLSTESMASAIKEYQNLLGLSGNSEKLAAMMERAYLEHDTLADATRYLVNALFAPYGLVIIDADDKDLKSLFAPIVEADILQQHSFRNINDTSRALADKGFATQVNAREINFFYMTEGQRERIVEESGTYAVLNTDLRFSSQQLAEEIRQHPERFSPNVVMRPLYQECILPNLAYIGGGAELVYWLQLKKNFDFYGLSFPVLLLRNSALITDDSFGSKLCRFRLKVKDIFKDTDTLKKEYVLNHTQHNLHLSDERNEFQAIFEKIKLRTYKIDPSLAPSTEAINARLKKALVNLEKKLLKAEKRNHEEALGQIERLKLRYFPGGSLQERSENFGLFYVKYGDSFIEELIRHLKPLNFKFTILQP